jgi:hypothetical protein
VDGTPFYRDRSKKAELLSRCCDHSKKRFYNGFAMLNAASSDGQTLIPVDFQLLASGDGKNLLEDSLVKEGNRTVATKRRGRSRYLLSVGIEIRHGEFEETVPAKLVFVRDRNNRTRYVFMVVENRGNKNDRTLGSLFFLSATNCKTSHLLPLLICSSVCWSNI